MATRIPPMTMTLQYGIAGVPELQQGLKMLPEAMAGQALNGAVRKAAGVITTEMVARAPVRVASGFKKFSKKSEARRGRGYLKRNLRTQLVNASKYNVLYSAGIKNAFKGKRRGAFYAYYEEYGTKHQPARPFLRPAYEAKKQEAMQVLLKELDNNLVKAARRLRKKVNVRFLTRGR